MSYMHIDNLYKNRDILLFKECYAMEKIHGTSAHISFEPPGALTFFSGGEKYDKFVALFNTAELMERFNAIGLEYPITVFGEAYGGKMQGMSKTYGPNLKFVAFEVRVGNRWLCVPDAEQIVRQLGLEFVFYQKIPATIEALDAVILSDSVQAIRNNMGGGHKREGVVLRPLIELTKNNNERIISKHKREDFQETKTKRSLEIDPEKLKVLEKADEIAEEWVTEMRLSHVLQQIPEPHDMTKCGDIAYRMVEDVTREAKNEIAYSKEARKAISRKAIELFKNRIKEKLYDNDN